MIRDTEKTIGNLIDHQKVAFIGSVGEDGWPNVKAMLAPRKREGLRRFWLSTNTSSRHVGQFMAQKKACLYFYDRRFFRGVMLQGRMEVLQDAHSKEKIWEKGDTQYYPLGVTDPDYCVLCFTAEKGRYYSSFKSEDFDIE